MSLLSQVQSNTSSVVSGKQSLINAIQNKGGTVTQAGDCVTFNELVAGVQTISSGGGGGGTIVGYDITTATELPYPVNNIRTYRDNAGDLHVAWTNPSKAFGGKVVVVRKQNGIPTLPIGTQNYNIIQNSREGIHYDKDTIPANTKYGFLVLPLNEAGQMQTIITEKNKVIDQSVNIRGGYVEIQLPDALQAETDLYSFMTRDGVVYLSSKNSSVLGIWRLDKTTNTLIQVLDTGYNWANWFEDSEGNVFTSSTASGYTGIYRYNPTTNLFEQVYTLTYNWNKFYEDTQGNVFVSSPYASNQGILKYDRTNNTFYQVSTADSDGLDYFYEDSKGNVFLCTYNTNPGVIYKYNRDTDTFDKLYSVSSSCTFDNFFESSQGDVFIWTSGDSKFLRYNPDTNNFSNLGLNRISKLYEDKQGNIFALHPAYGTYNQNDYCILKYNRDSQSFYTINNRTSTASTSSTSATNFYSDSQGNTFFYYYGSMLTTKGIYKYNSETDTFEIMLTVPTYSTSCIIYEDSYNNLFFFIAHSTTSSTYGVTTTKSYKYDRENNTIVSVGATISKVNTINFTQVIEVEPGQLYLSNKDTSNSSSYGNGLYKFNYNSNIFEQVCNVGRSYVLASDNDTQTIFVTNFYNNSSYNRYLVYDKTAGTYTATSGNYKYGIHFALNMYMNAYHIYHVDTDIVDSISGAYTAMLDIGDEATFNYALSLSTSTKYLIYNT